jgi:DNA-binding beta-propeller fold protein YncE
MRPRSRSIALFVSLAALACIPGCASAPGVIFAEPAQPLVWPPAPETPRIGYVGALVSSDDLKPGRSALASLGDAIFGREDPKGMVSPLGVCTDGKNRVFVVDGEARVVHVFDLDTRAYATWQPPEGVAAFQKPVAIAFDAAQGRLVVADAGAAILHCFDATGKHAGLLGRGVLKRPCGVAFSPATGDLVVADVESHQIVTLSRDGAEKSRLGARGTGEGEFNYPTFVTFDHQGRLYVSDSLNFRVQVFDASMKFVRQIGRKGDSPGYFSQPKGLCVDAEDHLYVIDANFESMQVFDDQGRLLLALGKEGRGPGEFWLPAGMGSDAQGRLWVADTYNKRVQVFRYLAMGATP